MRLVFASLLSVAVGQTVSAATQQALTTAISGCTQTLSAAFQNNQECTSVLSTVATFTQAGSATLNLAPFCTSACFPRIRSAYVAFGTCMQAYVPTLEAALRADGVADPSMQARTMMLGFNYAAKSFDFYCLKNERGDYCYNMSSQFSANVAAANGSSILDAVCGGYYNMGCCLPSLGLLYADISPTVGNVSYNFMTSLATTCPVLADYNPPVCPGFGQRAVALSVSMSLTGLSCSTYQAQSATFKAQYMAALKRDLAAHGIDADFITIVAITEASGVCTVKVLLRAASDDATNALNTAASTLNTASLTASNEVLGSVSGVGSVTAMGAATVSTTYVSGQSGSDASSGMIVGPSMALMAAFLAWLA